MIQNLVLNASQAMNGKGIITISAKNCEISSNHNLLKQGKYIEISVSDTGCGIAKENLSKIFKIYPSTGLNNTKFGGNGLGLLICYSIIRKHDGII